MLNRRRFLPILPKVLLLVPALLLLETGPASAQFSGPVDPASALSIPAAGTIQADALVKLMAAPAATRPLVFQVGSRLFFAQAHIPGSVYAGPGAQPAGLDLLASKVAGAAKNKLIVLYCGCCPWQRCPNVGPAYKRLRDLGFTNVKVLYLANNFGADWVSKGLPVENGE